MGYSHCPKAGTTPHSPVDAFGITHVLVMGLHKQYINLIPYFKTTKIAASKCIGQRELFLIF